MIAQALLPFERLATVRTHMRRFHGMLRLMDQQSGTGAEAIVALQAEERLAHIGAMVSQMSIIFAPIQKANFTQ